MDQLKDVRSLTFDERRPTDFGIVDGVAECVKGVREQARVGADQIKIFATGGVMEVTDRTGMQELSNDEIEAIFQEATKSGRFVAAHACWSARGDQILC